MIDCSAVDTGLIKEMTKRVLLGQALALLMSFTGVSTTKLVNNNASYPLLQSLTSYAFIFAVYGPLFLFVLRKFRHQKFADFSFFHMWWKYIILAVIDLEANYVVVLAYQYTDMMSIQLLDCFTVPCVLVLSFFVLRMKFAVTHIVGGVIAIGGLILLITLDADGLSRSESGGREVLGDMLCLVSSALYATSNVLTEWFIKPSKPALFLPCLNCLRSDSRTDQGAEEEVDSGRAPREPHDNNADLDIEEELPNVPVYVPVVEYIALMSGFALVLATIQFFAVEWKTFKPERSSWTGEDWLFQMLFGFTMLLVYTAMPTMFILSSAAFTNISLLTADIYAVIWNVAFFKIYPTVLFFVAYIVIVTGILLYNLTDVIRIPFCSSWNYPCGDPFKENEGMGSDRDEPFREVPVSLEVDEVGAESCKNSAIVGEKTTNVDYSKAERLP